MKTKTENPAGTVGPGAPSDRVFRIDENTSLDEVNALDLPPGCEYSCEFWQQGEGGVAENVRIEGNVFLDAGAGWGHGQRWNPGGTHLRFQDTTVPTPGFAVVGNRFSRATECLARLFNDWRGQALFRDNVWESAGEPVCVWHARPRAGLRFLCPDHLDRSHRDDRAEIESQGPGGRDFEATPEGFRAFEETFGFGPDEFRRTTL